MIIDTSDAWTGAERILDESACPKCGREGCDGRCESPPAGGLPAAGLADAVDVVREGQQIAAEGIPYIVDGVVPNLGTLGFLVAYNKVGKSTFGQGLGAAVATGRDFIERATRQTRVLVIAAEDPPQYVAWMARNLAVTPNCMTFYRAGILLDPEGLSQIATTVRTGHYGLVLVSSWQSVIRGLVRDENDNSGACSVVEYVKATARQTEIPWLIDAHSGKGEDQSDDADPTRALRGASAAAGAADYVLSLRYCNGTFGNQRKLSGRGRFVNLEPIVIDLDPDTGDYTLVGTTKNAADETTWRLICETGAISTEKRSASHIAKLAGLVDANGKASSTGRRSVTNALKNRHGVLASEEQWRERSVWHYRLSEPLP